MHTPGGPKRVRCLVSPEIKTKLSGPQICNFKRRLNKGGPRFLQPFKSFKSYDLGVSNGGGGAPLARGPCLFFLESPPGRPWIGHPGALAARSIGLAVRPGQPARTASSDPSTSIRRSVLPRVCVLVHLSVGPSVHPFTHPSTPFTHASIQRSTHPSSENSPPAIVGLPGRGERFPKCLPDSGASSCRAQKTWSCRQGMLATSAY